jgi:Tfp pilus assembly protein PilN
MPAYRIEAGRQRLRLRRWIGVCTGYALLLLGGVVASHGLWGGQNAALTEEQQKAHQRIQAATQATREVEAHLAAQSAMLQASRSAQDQPDWSLLLALVAQSLNEDVVLKQCDLVPGPTPGAPESTAAGRPPEGAGPTESAAVPTFRTAGYGKTMEAVLQFAQALERTGLFDQIRLVKTAPEAFLSGTAIGFQLDCALGQKMENSK